MKIVQRLILYIFIATFAVGCCGRENELDQQHADSLFSAELARAKTLSSEQEGNLDSARVILERLVWHDAIAELDRVRSFTGMDACIRAIKSKIPKWATATASLFGCSDCCIEDYY